MSDHAVHGASAPQTMPLETDSETRVVFTTLSEDPSYQRLIEELRLASQILDAAQPHPLR